LGRRVSSQWEVYDPETETSDTVEIDGIITDYDSTTDRYKVHYEDEDNPDELEAIPLVGDGSELRLIDGVGMYEEKINELLSTGKAFMLNFPSVWFYFTLQLCIVVYF